MYKKFQKVSLSADLVTLSLGQGHWKRSKTVVVKGASKHGIYERIRLKSLQIMSNSKDFTTQKIQRLAAQSDKHNCLHKLLCQSYGSKPLSLIQRTTDRTIQNKQFQVSGQHDNYYNFIIFSLFHLLWWKQMNITSLTDFMRKPNVCTSF